MDGSQEAAESADLQKRSSRKRDLLTLPVNTGTVVPLLPSPCVGHLQLLSVGHFVERGWIKCASNRSLLLQNPPSPVCFLVCRVSG